MASKLSFTPINDLPFPREKFSKPPLTIPIFPHLTLNSCSGFHLSKTISSSRASSSSSSSSSVCAAVKEQLIQSPNLESTQDSETIPPSSSKFVLVVGGSGGVGQLVVASLLNRNIKSRLLLRDPEKAATLFGNQDEEKLEVRKGDTRNAEDLDPSIFEGVTHVICCTGTTAFPSRRWDGDNTPERVDWEGVRNLVSALPPSLKRIVLVSSVGVTKFNELPWSIMNLFGVLKYKKMGEDFVRNSGLPYTIIRSETPNCYLLFNILKIFIHLQTLFLGPELLGGMGEKINGGSAPFFFLLVGHAGVAYRRFMNLTRIKI
ncbi:hypothetical protein ACSBR2_021616 [Camellia fascicularis]